MTIVLIALIAFCAGTTIYLAVQSDNNDYKIKCLEFEVSNIKLQMKTHVDERLAKEKEILGAKQETLNVLIDTSEMLNSLDDQHKEVTKLFANFMEQFSAFEDKYLKPSTNASAN